MVASQVGVGTTVGISEAKETRSVVARRSGLAAVKAMSKVAFGVSEEKWKRLLLLCTGDNKPISHLKQAVIITWM